MMRRSFFEWVNKMIGMDIGIISLADTVGLATAEQVFDMTNYLVEVIAATEIEVAPSFYCCQTGEKSWRLRYEPAVCVLTAPSRELAVAPWPTMISLEI